MKKTFLEIMSTEQKTMWFTGVYRGFMSVSVLTLLFNGGIWKKEIEERSFETPKEKYEYIDKVGDLEEKQLEHQAALQEFRDALIRIEAKIDVATQ